MAPENVHAYIIGEHGESQVPVPLEDAIGNMAVIEAIFRSAESAGWEIPQK